MCHGVQPSHQRVCCACSSDRELQRLPTTWHTSSHAWPTCSPCHAASPPKPTAEILGWVCFTVATQTAAAGLFTLVGAAQMAQWAIGKHARLRKVRLRQGSVCSLACFTWRGGPLFLFRQRPAVECARFSGRPLLGWWGLCSRPDGSRPPVCSAVSSNRPTLASVGVPPAADV